MHATIFDNTTTTERIIVQSSIGLFVATLTVSGSITATIIAGILMIGAWYSIIQDAAGR